MRTQLVRILPELRFKIWEGHSMVHDPEIGKAPEHLDDRGRQAFAGGLAKGVWNGRPIALTTCGMAFMRTAPLKKQVRLIDHEIAAEAG